MNTGRIVRITGSMVEARSLPNVSLFELVRVGHAGLLGEVVRVEEDRATVQVYEDTTGLSVGEPVEPTGTALTAQLGPGLLGAVLDGVGRPLDRLADLSGPFILPGRFAPTLDPERRWCFRPRVQAGAHVSEGDILGTVEERPGFEHFVLVPPGVSGTVASISEGEFGIDQPFGSLENGTLLKLSHRWPVRHPRPDRGRLVPDRPFLTGQRVLDFLFPVAEGGTVAVPGGFGTGKTVIEQSLARHAEADVVVFVACGERGNEMAEVLTEFPNLLHPRTGRPVTDRSVLVVNTSNMPIAAREASVYLGLTIAEYYRDMGYHVAVMADSISRWAEALRESAARMQEMPGEEGYPTYLSSRLAKLCERAGNVRTLGSPERYGAVTFIPSVSPPGGDLSEPVTQSLLRVVGALWSLDASLARQRHFPAVDWATSHSLYTDVVAPWFAANVCSDWAELRKHTLTILQREAELREIASLVGTEALQDRDRLVLEVARVIRESVLAQSAFDVHDGFSPPFKTHRLVVLTHALYRQGLRSLEKGIPFEHLDFGTLRRSMVSLRSVSLEDFEAAARKVEDQIASLGSSGGP